MLIVLCRRDPDARTLETQGWGLAARLMRASAVVLAVTAFTGCTLITDVDREKIPVETPPPFPEDDAGAGDAAPDEVDPPDASDESDADAPPPADAGGDAADAAPGEPVDGGDAGASDGG